MKRNPAQDQCDFAQGNASVLEFLEEKEISAKKGYLGSKWIFSSNQNREASIAEGR